MSRVLVFTLRVAAGVLMASLLAGCSAVGYYAQAVHGHFDLMGRREPIDVLVDSPPGDVDAELQATLQRVLEIRDFASAELALPDNDSYRSYADLERPYVVWNVVAAPTFSLAPKRWCFLFVGCLSYKGFFAEERARREAQRLRERGYDVVVGGVAAYSTLGRFADPFLNTMVGYSEAQTAALIFHELAHQQLYVKGETAFNEAFASFVAEEGVKRWLARDGDAGAEQFAAWQRGQQRRLQFTSLVLDAREELLLLYARDDLDEAARQAAKQAAFDRLRERYERLRDQAWGGYEGYDAWFDTLNNAKLVSVATYRRLIPAFRALFVEAERDFASFFAQAQTLARAPSATREQRLQALLGVSSTARRGDQAPRSLR
jgi:predicted aminopeptidase